MAKRIAIVPARGGSKRLPDKNIRPFCGKPMLAHIVTAAQKSELFDVVHVSTDDERIAQVAAQLGLEPAFMRPAELADDHTPLMPVLRWVVEEYARRGQTFDHVALLMACSPLVTPDDLRGAVDLMDKSGGKRPVLAVSTFPAPIEWAFRKLADGSLEPVTPGMFAVRSQDLEPKYYDSGTFVLFPIETVMKSTGAGDDGKFIAYPLSRESAVDIDTRDDWEFAEQVWRGRAYGANDDGRGR